jgi:diketogulonate reductase-like aldo/keto reductase
MTTTSATAAAVELAGGVRMPLLGFGTWQLSGGDARRAVADALEVGYRHLDTATMYGNEAEVGRALHDSGVPRDEVFVTTKLPPSRARQARQTLEESLQSLGLDRLDLWLVHWPIDGGASPQTWSEFIRARDEGLTRAIGVSNYSPAQLDELTQATGETPAVNQIEWSPALYDRQRHAEHLCAEQPGLLEFSGTRLCHPIPAPPESPQSNEHGPYRT